MVSEKTETPLVATFMAAVASGLFALLLDLEALAELVSVGSLVCFLLVNAACVWRRYAVPVAGEQSPAPGQSDLSAEGGTYSTGLAAAMEKVRCNSWHSVWMCPPLGDSTCNHHAHFCRKLSTVSFAYLCGKSTVCTFSISVS